ncbi:winged helix-turn-helix transcriptional regulator [Streptomyces specialis]|uniref:winged helix-turn-helix transcriptional regulator n=1 Tax=Streptomyces specialis TaxID=498367 RepID=UPI00073E541D|nr:winged helix-turn-helix transcriptional regulator [Streptomyces specialis]
MSNAASAGNTLITAVDTEHVEKTLSLIAPKWTTWCAQTLAQHDRPMRLRDIAEQLPFVATQLLHKRLSHMHADGLVTRPDDRRGAPYRLSTHGSALEPVHRALSEWSRAQVRPDPVADAERIEDALGRLHLRHSTAVIQFLDAEGPSRFVDIAEGAGLDNGMARQRLIRLQLDGLVTRDGPHHGAPYLLTDAARGLGPVYGAVSHWGDILAGRPPSASPTATVTQDHAASRPTPPDPRSTAALRRTTVATDGLFSHAPQPQRPVPAAVTAQSFPPRHR